MARAKGDEKAALLARTKDLAGQVKAAQAASDSAGATFDELMNQLPNLVFDDVPRGGEDDFTVVETVGTPRDFAAEGFRPRDHLEIGECSARSTWSAAPRCPGSRFYFLTGIGARLELALINLAMTKAMSWGFTPMLPPALVKPSAMEGTGFLGQAAQDVYHLPADDLYLVGTSEVALAAYHSEEILDAASLPRRYVGYSPCFRREAGSLRQGHPRHLPGALVRQGRDVRLLRPGRRGGRAPGAAGLREGVHRRRWRSRSRCSRSPPATSG